MKCYLVKCSDSQGERQGIFYAKTTKEAYKKAKKQLHIYGDAEYSFKVL